MSSGVRQVFTPHQPISEASLLFGRQSEVRKLIETLNTPGQHMLLFGERGVGKSSLANVAVRVLLQASTRSVRTFTKRCDQTDVFETIMYDVLNSVGAGATVTALSTTTSVGTEGRIGPSAASVAHSDKSDTTTHYTVASKLSPSTVASAISHIDGLLIIDEFDAIQDNDDRRRVAELIKQLSDGGSAFKILVVGIAESGDQLTAAHPSVQRCLKETKLQRMPDVELEEIVTVGAQAVSIRFEPAVTDSIVRLSAGYPHFTHLLALKAAEKTIGAGRSKVNSHDLNLALGAAVEDAEGTLKRVYDDSTRSSTSSMYRLILAAAASLDTEEFSSGELRSAIEQTTGEPISQYSLNNYFQRLMSKDKSTILRRVGQGVYRFEDPRMRSYVRIMNKMT